VTRRELLPVGLVLLSILTDALNLASLSFYLLLAAVPAIVVAGLAAVEEQLQSEERLPHRRAMAMLHVVTLLLVLTAAALRAPLRAEGTVPQAAVSAGIACLVVFGIQALLASLPAIRRQFARPAPSQQSF
jgi:uncharacterized membrane protein